MIELFPLLGIRTLGGFARLPASTIPNRFGPIGADLHRRARADDAPLLRPFEPSVTYRETVTIEEPIAALEPLLFLLKGALDKLESRAKKDANSALKISLLLETESAQELEVSVPLTRPIRNASGWLGVLREKFAGIEIQAPLVSFSVEISLPIRMRGAQFHLFDTSEQSQEPLDELLGRLIAGLGPTVVSAATLRARHRPEKSWTGIPFEPLATPKETAKSIRFFPRPTLLLHSPAPIRADGLLPISGPERLAGEWWDGEGHGRDYFMARNRSGQLLWIFKDLKKKELFLHGYFD
jgi:protein ImuB